MKPSFYLFIFITILSVSCQQQSNESGAKSSDNSAIQTNQQEITHSEINSIFDEVDLMPATHRISGEPIGRFWDIIRQNVDLNNAQLSNQGRSSAAAEYNRPLVDNYTHLFYELAQILKNTIGAPEGSLPRVEIKVHSHQGGAIEFQVEGSPRRVYARERYFSYSPITKDFLRDLSNQLTQLSPERKRILSSINWNHNIANNFQRIENQIKKLDPKVEIKTLFSYPKSSNWDDRDLTLENKIISLLNQAMPGSKVRASQYSFSRRGVADAVVRASRRGVDVRVVVSNRVRYQNGDWWKSISSMKDELHDKMHICSRSKGVNTGGCIGDRTNHNKFFIFSSLRDGRQNVVIQSSANLNRPSLNYYESMLIISGDTKLFDAYMSYWEDQRAEHKDTDYYLTATGNSGIRASFFPSQQEDPIYKRLKNVNCKKRGTEILVKMGHFTNGRQNIANLLADMSAQGCTIKVLTPSSNTGGNIESILASSSVQHKISSGSQADVHSKNILIRETVTTDRGDEKVEHYLLMGSHNLTPSSLRRNEEAYLEIDNNREVYNSFRENFKTVWDTL